MGPDPSTEGARLVTRFPMDIAQIAAEASPATGRLAEVAEGDRGPARASRRPPTGLEDGAPLVEGLIAELHELLERLGSLGPSPAGAPTTLSASQELGRLGDRGIGLLSQLGHWANRFQLLEEAAGLGRLSLHLACWIAQQGAEIGNLAPLVDRAAALANSLQDPQELERLFLQLGEIQDAVAPAIGQDPDRSDPRRPWRILLLNRAIVATRTHQPPLMEEAFRHLIENLPEDAPTFFREGMEQMHLLDYPERVRRVMQRYYDHWCSQALLH